MEKVKLNTSNNDISHKQILLSLITPLSNTLRIGGISQINHLLIEFTDALNTFILNSPFSVQQKLIPFVTKMAEAHARSDWLCLADIIQYNIYLTLKD